VAARYETETRRNTTETQRRQAAVDLLNRRIDAARQKLIAEGVSDELVEERMRNLVFIFYCVKW
jgi:hypothetical protein